MNRFTAPASPSSTLPDTSKAAGSLVWSATWTAAAAMVVATVALANANAVAAATIPRTKTTNTFISPPVAHLAHVGAYSAVPDMRDRAECKVPSSPKPSRRPCKSGLTLSARVVESGAYSMRESFIVRVARDASGKTFCFTIGAHALTVVALLFIGFPALFVAGSTWGARAVISDLLRQNAALQVENANYRDATGQLSAQVSSLQAAADTLRAA